MLQTNEVRVAVTGEVFRGPQSVQAPTGTTGPVPDGLIGLGYLDEKGVTEDPNKSVKSIKAWQNGAEVRTLVTDGKLSMKFRMIQTNKATTETFYGTEVEQTSEHGTYDIKPTSTGGRQSWLFDYIDGDKHRRVWVPEGEVTDTSAISFVGTDERGYEVTISCYPSDSLDGANARVWDTALAAA